MTQYRCRECGVTLIYTLPEASMTVLQSRNTVVLYDDGSFGVRCRSCNAHQQVMCVGGTSWENYSVNLTDSRVLV